MKNIDVNAILKDNKIDGLLVTNPVNIFYLTGFRGVSPTEREALLIVKKPKSILITAKLYQTEARKIASSLLDVKIAAERDQYENFLKSALSNTGKLAFESDDLKFAEYKKFKKLAKPNKFAATKNLIEDLRKTKSEEEIRYIEKAQLITQQAFEQIVKTIRISQTEEEIAEKLTQIMRNLGSQGPSFNPIVASGPNSALPHHVSGKRRIKKGDTLVLDFGAKYQNYCADFTRTIFIGRASDEQRKIYNLVFKAQQSAISTTKSQIKAKSVFETAHNIFKKENVDKYFTHSLGHGIGLEVHEKPSLSAKSKDRLTTGIVFSVEPGLYFPWGGARIEDLLAIVDRKPIVLGRTAKFIEISQKV